MFEIANALKSGPLAFLRDLFLQRRRVRVITRHRKGRRGVCTGVIYAVDKHWNMVLKQVEEEYTILVKFRGEKRSGQCQEKRKRSLKQIFLTGCSIVLISPILYDQKY